MEKKFIYPNFSNSNINISATLAEFLGVPNKNSTIELLQNELKNGYKNVVFICFDGLGIYPLKKHLKEYELFLKENKAILYSTFPSTTTNATTSLLSNTLPSEHGWFGWSVYFDYLQKNIDIFSNKDSWSGEKIDDNKIRLLRPKYYFDNEIKTDYKINTVFPEYVKVDFPKRNYVYKTEKEFFNILEDICKKEEKQFIYAYYPDPDHTMHEHGVSSKQTHKVITNLQNGVRNLKNSTQNSIFIITADHGQIDIEGYVEFYKDKKLMDMLKIYPYLDSRSPAFIVKEDKFAEFENYFQSKYSKDFELHKTSELIEQGIFGKTQLKDEFRNSLGDYIAIGTYTHKQGLLTAKSERFKGHHTSLTEEMEVPLIIITN